MNDWRKRHSLLISVAGVVVFLISGHFGSSAIMLVGFPTLLIACGITAGARLPSHIPNRDALVYIGVGVLVVIGIVLYEVYSRR